MPGQPWCYPHFILWTVEYFELLEYTEDFFCCFPKSLNHVHIQLIYIKRSYALKDHKWVIWQSFWPCIIFAQQLEWNSLQDHKTGYLVKGTLALITFLPKYTSITFRTKERPSWFSSCSVTVTSIIGHLRNDCMGSRETVNSNMLQITQQCLRGYILVF